MPRVQIDLMLREAEKNDPFYARITEEFLREANARHRRFPLVRALEFGVALLLLPRSFDDYFMRLEGSARRNYKKALKAGCQFRRIDYNRHLDEIAAIRASAPVRQGAMPENFLKGEVAPCRNPASRSPLHDYPYFGVFKDGRLVAYAGCAVYGELCMIEHIYGHADYQQLGVTPMLVIGIADYVISNHPAVNYYGYGTFFGGARKLQRFKRKLGFMPHQVEWLPGRSEPESNVRQFVFRKVSGQPPVLNEKPDMQFVHADGPRTILAHRTALRRQLGGAGLIKAFAKTVTHRRSFFFVLQDDIIIHYGWISLGFCRYYAIEESAAVVGPVWTAPQARGKGAASFALQYVIDNLYRRSHAVVYIDTSSDNAAMLRVIEKCEFGPAVGSVGKTGEF